MENPTEIETPAEMAENAAMERAREDGPAALTFLQGTALVKDAYLSGVAPDDVERFVFEVIFALGHEGLLRQHLPA